MNLLVPCSFPTRVPSVFGQYGRAETAQTVFFLTLKNKTNGSCLLVSSRLPFLLIAGCSSR